MNKPTLALAALLALSTAAWAEDPPPADPTLAGDTARAVGETVKKDAKVVAEAVKDGAQQVASTAKEVGHEVAAASKQGAKQIKQGAKQVAETAKKGGAQVKATVSGQKSTAPAPKETPEKPAN